MTMFTLAFLKKLFWRLFNSDDDDDDDNGEDEYLYFNQHLPKA